VEHRDVRMTHRPERFFTMGSAPAGQVYGCTGKSHYEPALEHSLFETIPATPSRTGSPRAIMFSVAAILDAAQHFGSAPDEANMRSLIEERALLRLFQYG